MSYTHPFGQPQGEARLVTGKLREALIAEIIAINGYTEHIANSTMKDINSAWYTIMGDEKKHYGMFLTLLRKYDPEQYKAYQYHLNDTKNTRSSMQTYVPNYDKQIILNNLREDKKGEFEASILYEDLADHISQSDVKSMLLSISAEEKGHAEHLTKLLLKYDPDQYNGLK
jgi:rubrerythrin